MAGSLDTAAKADQPGSLPRRDDIADHDEGDDPTCKETGDLGKFDLGAVARLEDEMLEIAPLSRLTEVSVQECAALCRVQSRRRASSIVAQG